MLLPIRLLCGGRLLALAGWHALRRIFQFRLGISRILSCARVCFVAATSIGRVQGVRHDVGRGQRGMLSREMLARVRVSIFRSIFFLNDILSRVIFSAATGIRPRQCVVISPALALL